MLPWNYDFCSLKILRENETFILLPSSTGCFYVIWLFFIYFFLLFQLDSGVLKQISQNQKSQNLGGWIDIERVRK